MLLLLTSALGLVAVTLWPLTVETLLEACSASDLVQERRCIKAPNKLFGHVAIIAAFPAVLLLERFWPAARSQTRFSTGLLVDFLWFCFAPLFFVLLIIPVEDALKWLQHSYFELDPLVRLHNLPLWVQIPVVVLLADFMHYVAHVIRHKSAFVWEFHKIHHAQEELNYFSAARVHPIDSLTINLVSFLPFALLEANIVVPAFVGWKVFLRIYAMFTHSNLRLNLGPLRYVLVTPQSHRIHHSDRSEHRDLNFGNVFAIWDFMFGTQCRDFNVYPATGVDDKRVPRPARPSLPAALVAYGAQLVYPFSSLRRPAPAPERES
jgi:sterol desaturase/sphingolipid hydroxylase (fatty acid hydroxylase superfamily)